MTELVADTSALVSLGIVANTKPDPVALCLERYDVLVPEVVIDELREVASFDDVHSRAANAVLARTAEMTILSVDHDAEFPLDDGENAAVTLANDIAAAVLLCDEFNRLGIIHASLVDTRLLTTPTLLSVFVQTGEISSDEARAMLDEICTARSWDTNSYVQRARSMLDET